MPNPESADPKPSSPITKRKEAVLEKILVPIDFSDYASAAIDYAVRIGKLAGTHIALLYVVEIPRHQFSVDVYSSSERIRSNLNEMQMKAQERLESLAREIRTPGIECTASVRLGIPYEQILAEAEKMESDLIVLGGKGYSALARILLGSTAEQVVRFARCSVLSCSPSSRETAAHCGARACRRVGVGFNPKTKTEIDHRFYRLHR